MSGFKKKRQLPSPPDGQSTNGQTASPSNSQLQDFLKMKMHATGRVNPTGPLSVMKREAYSGEILQGMESATQERQRQANLANGTSKPLAHAVSGHGKGTDQISRLTHGRRNDELMEDRQQGLTPSDSISLSGNKHGLPDQSVPAYDKVGTDPSSVSGAFKSHTDMLHVVESAYSQASMLSRYSEQERAKARGDGPIETDKMGLDQERFVPTVKGSHDDIGYSMLIDDPNSVPSIKKGQDVSEETMQKRFGAIRREEGLGHSTVVMDPAHVDGRRAGWDIQTAFASNAPLTSDLSSVQAVQDDLGKKAQLVVLNQELSQEKAQLALAQQAVAKAKQTVKSAENAIKGMKTGIATKTAKLADAEPDAKAGLQTAIETLEKRVALMEQKAQDATDGLPALEQAELAAQGKVDAVQLKIDSL